MKLLFEYNWQVRNEWFEWCKNVSPEELLDKRTGGVGSILHTLFHIVDVEMSWIRAIEGKQDIPLEYKDYMSLEEIRKLSMTCNDEIQAFLNLWPTDFESKAVRAAWFDNVSFTAGEILRHVIAHEIHHIGQLSIWARELELKPVSSNYIFRGLSNTFLNL